MSEGRGLYLQILCQPSICSCVRTREKKCSDVQRLGNNTAYVSFLKNFSKKNFIQIKSDYE